MTVVCENDPVMTAYYTIEVDLIPREPGKPAPAPADITRQTPPPRA
jgi:hypothetical protein